MENASDAIKMAAAVLIFVGALSLAIFAFSKARQASTAIMSNAGNKEYYDAENLNVTSNRKVGIETIIPTLYSYYKENTTILFYKGTGYNSENNTFDTITPITLYYTEALDTTSNLSQKSDLSPLQKSTLAVKEGQDGKNSRAIYGVDINDELTRQEPWSYNETYSKKFIDDLINLYDNASQLNKNQSQKYYTSKKNLSGNNYFGKDSNGPFYQLNFKYLVEIGGKLITNTKAKFVERIGQYNYNALYASTSGNQTYTGTDVNGSTVTFSNNQTISNESGNQKKVIQYIYINN